VAGAGVAPVASRGGELAGARRKGATPHHFSRCKVRSNEEKVPRRVAWLVELGSGRNCAGDEWWRWPKLGELADDATASKTDGVEHIRPLHAQASTMATRA
jgi:hypothetical protein